MIRDWMAWMDQRIADLGPAFERRPWVKYVDVDRGKDKNGYPVHDYVAVAVPREAKVRRG